jgi:hypothetical protein
MRYYCHWLVTLAACFFLHKSTLAQSVNDSSTIQLPVQYLSDVADKGSRIQDKLNAKTTKVLRQFRKQQNKMRRKLLKIDSASASKIFNSVEERFTNLEQSLQQPQKNTVYIPFLDTLKTSLKFLDENSTLLTANTDCE